MSAFDTHYVRYLPQQGERHSRMNRCVKNWDGDFR